LLKQLFRNFVDIIALSHYNRKVLKELGSPLQEQNPKLDAAGEHIP
jgi:hypothetical protein